MGSQTLPTGSTYDPRVSYVIRRICQDATSKIHLSDLAQEASLTPSHLQHLFRKNVGRSVKNLMGQLRLIQAERLLKHSNLTVAEIARRVGFEDRSNFHRSFKKQFGVTPLSVRAEPRSAGQFPTSRSSGRGRSSGTGQQASSLVSLLQEKRSRLLRLEGQVELLEGLLQEPGGVDGEKERAAGS